MDMTQAEYKVLEEFIDLLDIWGEMYINQKLIAIANGRSIKIPRMLKWSKEELDLLIEQYPKVGSKIPELREKFTAKQIGNRAQNLGLVYNTKQNNKSAWTDYQINFLTANYPIYGADIPELLKLFSRSQIITKAYHLGLCKQDHWTDEDNDILVREYPKVGSNIPELLSKYTLAAIQKKARKKGLRVANKHVLKWSGKNIEVLREKYPSCGSNIPELLGKFSKRVINAKAANLGLRRVYDEPNRTSDRNKFTDEEIALLFKNYERYGTAIPELLKRHTAQTITQKANSLGLYYNYDA